VPYVNTLKQSIRIRRDKFILYIIRQFPVRFDTCLTFKKIVYDLFIVVASIVITGKIELNNRNRSVVDL